MSDQHEQDPWDQDEIEIMDLDAPEKGLSRYVFTLGEKWRAASVLRGKLVAPLVALNLLIAVLLVGSSGVNTRTSGAPHPAPGYSSPSTIYLIDCHTTINVSSLPANVFVWEQVISTPSTQECDFLKHPGSQCPSLSLPSQMPTVSPGQEVVWGCRVGTPLPKPLGNPGKNR